MTVGGRGARLPVWGGAALGLALAGCDRVGSETVYDLDGDGVLAGADCDDHDAAVFPSADELCNDRDDDCDGVADEDLKVEAWPDRDRDGYGESHSDSTLVCVLERGWSDNHRDCDDDDGAVRPGESELCDGRDQDCDDLVDEELPLFVAFQDLDQDGFGDPEVSVSGCSVPHGFVDDPQDCDDRSPSVHPGATEICNRVDENCNGTPDDGLTITGWIDADGDTWGSPDSAQPICPYDAGFVARGGDCDDGDAAVFPGFPEVCNGLDDDCDTVVDNGVSQPFFLDADGDGFGLPGVSVAACEAPAGFVTDNTDCDDLLAENFPGNTEICDEADNDCDGLVDEGQPVEWYADLDGDGLGDPFTLAHTCFPPAEFVAVDGDCDDSDAAIPPNCPPTLFDDWPQRGADSARSGHVLGTVGTGVLSLQWEQDLGSALDPVVAAGGRVFASVGGTLAADQRITGLEIDSGDLLWEYPIGPTQFVGAPVWGDPQVCATIGDLGASSIVCLDEETGLEDWVAPVTATATESVGGLVHGSKLLSPGGGAGGLYAHQLGSGLETWFVSLPNVATPWGAAASGQSVFVWDSLFYEIDLFTGVQSFSTSLGLAYPTLPVVPVIGGDGTAYVTGSTALVAYDTVNHAQRWSQVIAVSGFPAVDDASVYVVRTTGVAEERSTATGALVRTFSGATGLVGPPVVTDDAVVMSSTTTTYVFSRATGDLLQSVPDGGAIAIADNHLLLAESNGLLHVYTW